MADPKMELPSGATLVDSGTTPVDDQSKMALPPGATLVDNGAGAAVEPVIPPTTLQKGWAAATKPLLPAGKAEETGRAYAEAPITLADSQHPHWTGLKKGMAGTAADTMETVRQVVTSPLGIATLGLGELTRLPGAIGKIASTGSKLAGVGFAGQSAVSAAEAAKDIVENGPSKENIQRLAESVGWGTIIGLSPYRKTASPYGGKVEGLETSGPPTVKTKLGKIIANPENTTPGGYTGQTWTPRPAVEATPLGRIPYGTDEAARTTPIPTEGPLYTGQTWTPRPAHEATLLGRIPYGPVEATGTTPISITRDMVPSTPGTSMASKTAPDVTDIIGRITPEIPKAVDRAVEKYMSTKPVAASEAAKKAPTVPVVSKVTKEAPVTTEVAKEAPVAPKADRVISLSNADVAERLEQRADELDASGQDAYRIAAYRNAAASVRRLGEQNILELNPKEIAKIPGIGKSITARILEMASEKPEDNAARDTEVRLRVSHLSNADLKDIGEYLGLDPAKYDFKRGEVPEGGHSKVHVERVQFVDDLLGKIADARKNELHEGSRAQRAQATFDQASMSSRGKADLARELFAKELGEITAKKAQSASAAAAVPAPVGSAVTPEVPKEAPVAPAVAPVAPKSEFKWPDLSKDAKALDAARAEMGWDKLSKEEQAAQSQKLIQRAQQIKDTLVTPETVKEAPKEATPRFNFVAGAEGVPHVLEIYRGDEPVGHLAIEQQSPESWTIKDAAIKPEAQGQGLGVAAYKRAIAEAEKAGMKEITSDISTTQAAKHVWDSLMRDDPRITEENGQYTVNLAGEPKAEKTPSKETPKAGSYGDAVRFVQGKGVAGVMSLAKGLGISAGDAIRHIDRMEAEGIIGPENGANAREILKPR